MLYTDFAVGDLLYGLHDYRKPYVQALKQKVGQQVTADTYNNRMFGLLSVTLSTSSSSTSSTVLSPNSRRYFRHFSANAAAVNVECADEDDRVLKVACLQNFLRKDINIRFLLEGILPEAIYDPRHKRYNSFTSEELRYYFENHSKVADHVIFYQASSQITIEAWLAQFNIASVNDFVALINESAKSQEESHNQTAVLATPPKVVQQRRNALSMLFQPGQSSHARQLFTTPPTSPQKNSAVDSPSAFLDEDTKRAASNGLKRTY